ncbi:hypothetical protein ACQ4PT_060612 [Festuca glaucescens]
MVRPGALGVHHTTAVDDLVGSPAVLALLALVATVAVAAVAAFGCAKGAKKPRRQDNNGVYYYGKGHPPPPPAGAYGYTPQQKHGRSELGAGAGLALGGAADEQGASRRRPNSASRE